MWFPSSDIRQHKGGQMIPMSLSLVNLPLQNGFSHEFTLEVEDECAYPCKRQSNVTLSRHCLWSHAFHCVCCWWLKQQSGVIIFDKEQRLGFLGVQTESSGLIVTLSSPYLILTFRLSYISPPILLKLLQITNWSLFHSFLFDST